MTQYADRLAQMDAAYDSATAGAVLPPDGEYQAVIDRFDFLESPKNGRLYLKTIATVAVGPQQGKQVSTLHDLEDPERLGYLKKHLSVLEVEPASLRNLEESLSSALDCPFLVAVKTTLKGGETYRNVYFNQRLGGPLSRTLTDVPASAGPAPSSAIEADIPF